MIIPFHCECCGVIVMDHVKMNRKYCIGCREIVKKEQTKEAYIRIKEKRKR
jgi:hypothetical protein